MKRIYILFVIAIILLSIGAAAWGRDAKPDEGKTITDVKINPPIALIIRSPWPTFYGNPDRARCSDLKGPGGDLSVGAAFDLFNLFGYEYLKIDKEFRGMLLGPGNDIYLHYWDNFTSTLIAYRHGYGKLWDASMRYNSNFCLDRSGRVYYLRSYGQDSEDRYEVVCRSANGTIHWTYRFGPAGIIDILTVGKRVYVGEVASQKFYITAINFNSTEAWKKGPYEYDSVFYCAEDDEGNMFLRFEDESLGIHKFSEDGTLLWQAPLTSEGIANPDFASGTDSGPICVGAGRVWSDESDVTYGGIGGATPFYVLENDGSFYKTGHLEPGNGLTRVCYGKDGRLYAGQTGGVITCYDDFDQEVWSVQLPFRSEAAPGGFISAMILDRDNTIYAVYVKDEERMLYALDPSDGHKLGGTLINTVGEPGFYDWLAIGENEKLIWLNSKGFLKIFMKRFDLPRIPVLKEVPIRREKIK